MTDRGTTDEMPLGWTGESHPEVYERFPRSNPLKPGQLSDEQMETYLNNGFLVVKDFFKPEDLDPVRDTIKTMVEGLADKLFDAGKIKCKYEEYDFFHRLTMIEEEFSGANILLHKIGIMPEAFTKVAQHPLMLNLLEDFLGPDIAFNPVWNLRTKTPRSTATVVPWHQDNAYMDKRSYETLIMSAWIPLLDTTRENGTMEFVRGSHSSARVAKHSCCAGPTWYVMLEEEDMEKELGSDMSKDSFVLDVPYGSFILFNNFTAHRSLDNFSDKVRWSLDFRWQKANTSSCFYGLKDTVLLRTASNPDYEPDWKTFNEVDRITAAIAIGQKDNADASDFNTEISGPWMKFWPIVHENRHTRSFVDDETKWNKN